MYPLPSFHHGDIFQNYNITTRIFIFIFYFVAAPFGMWDLTCAPYIGSMESWSLDHQGSPHNQDIYMVSANLIQVFPVLLVFICVFACVCASSFTQFLHICKFVVATGTSKIQTVSMAANLLLLLFYNHTHFPLSTLSTPISNP